MAQPGDDRLAPGYAVAPERVKIAGTAGAGCTGAADDTAGPQPEPGDSQQIDIDPARTDLDRARDVTEMPGNLFPNLVVTWPNRRAKRCEHGLALKRIQRGIEHTRPQSSPATVHNSNPRTRRIGQDNRQTIRNHDGYGCIASGGVRGIRNRRGRRNVINTNNSPAMNLLKPCNLWDARS